MTKYYWHDSTSELKWERVYAYPQTYLPPAHYMYQCIYQTTLPPTKEGVEMKGLYEVWLIYAEDRKYPLIRSLNNIIADSEEDAKIKSGLMASVDPDWDTDYLTFIVKKVGDVKVKEKPKEVKQI